ncbi:MAG: sigma-70 family RNA polymerase sigma factor [Nanoarchaeota archaeon]|nr:sigma-70 family RNA polymerase sigma factor [Nanoarchaeota archaeon]
MKNSNTTDQEDILNMYIRDINKYPLLNRKEEIGLALRVREGDTIAREKLVKSNLRFVVSVAKSYAFNGNLPDLIQEGNAGLMQAVDKFDVDRGTKFVSYAAWWINQAILKYLSRSNIIPLSSNQRKLQKEINSIKERYYQEYGEDPNHEFIASRLNELGVNQRKDYRPSDVKDLLNHYPKIEVSSLNFDDKDGGKLEEIIADNGWENGFKEVETKSIRKVIAEGIKTLKPEEQEIFELILGYNLHLPDVYEILLIPKEVIKQRYGRGLTKLNLYLIKNRDLAP